MKKTTSLCFTNKGLMNPRWTSYVEENPVDTLVLFCDGSPESVEHLKEFDAEEWRKTYSIAVGFTPLYELRVQRLDGSISKPHFVYSDDVRAMWLASNIATSHIGITVSDVTSDSDTQVQLNDQAVQSICYFAYQIWQRLKVAEEKLCFPAAAIDRLTRLTYHLTPQTMDIDKLRLEMNYPNLSYQSDSQMLFLDVAGDTFAVRVDVLNRFYGEYILPLFNSVHGRRLRLTVTVKGGTGEGSKPTEMTYGELGSLVESMTQFVQEKKITATNPLNAADLLTFSKKVKINEESCVWLEEGQSLESLVDARFSDLSRDVPESFSRSDIDLDVAPRELEKVE